MKKVKNFFIEKIFKIQNKKIIKFIPQTKDVEAIVQEPMPSKNFLPEWYKKMKIKMGESKYIIATDGTDNKTVKSCIPVFDSMTSGYILTLPCDIFATIDTEKEKYDYRLFWHTNWVMVTEHSKFQYPGMHIPEQYEEVAFKWENKWIIKTPPGYSCLFLHPINHFELPFYTLTGIVDTDEYNLPVNFPFLLNKKFDGIIKKGTPIVQIIPFKRDNWKSIKGVYDKKNEFNKNDLKSVMHRSYATRWWKRKKYD